ncbi:MAG: hypothetical protein DHS20C18_50160 [Saprospiraceae bacterium]|nr:MAG: hypothetical protein DHS20C18_50160 [Saprospiraceae bacterium]
MKNILTLLREQKKITLHDMSRKLEISKDEVCSYEQDPDSISRKLFKKWADIFELTTFELDQIIKEAILDHDDWKILSSVPYAKFDQVIKNFILHLTNIKSNENEEWMPESYMTSRLIQAVKLKSQRPNLVLSGAFDTGKSRVANALLGTDKLPTRFQPATATTTCVRHLSLRPKWFGNDLCWIFKQNFDFKKWEDFDYCKQFVLARGNFDTLAKYGVHNYESKTVTIGGAIAFLDAKILEGCTIWDSPGYGNDGGIVAPSENLAQSDSNKADYAIQNSDILLYLSNAKGFLAGSDFTALSRALDSLPLYEADIPEFPLLGNLYIIASQADDSIHEASLKEILNKGSKRFASLFDKALLRRYSKTGRKVSDIDVRNRFFSFWFETPKRRERLGSNLQKLLVEQMPQIIAKQTMNVIHQFQDDADRYCRQQVLTYSGLIEKTNEWKEWYSNLTGHNSHNHLNRVRNEKIKIELIIRESKDKAILRLRQEYYEITKQERLSGEINQKYDNRNDAKDAAAYILEEIKDVVIKSNETLAKSLQNHIDSFLILNAEPFNKRSDLPSNFDPELGFISALERANREMIGALEYWVSAHSSSIASSSNARFIYSFFSNSIVANLANLAANLAYRIGLKVIGKYIDKFVGWITGKKWYDRVAEGIIEGLKDEMVLSKFENPVSEFWNDTSAAFEIGAEGTMNEYNTYIRDLGRFINKKSSSVNELAQRKDYFKAKSEFYKNLKLPESLLK